MVARNKIGNSLKKGNHTAWPHLHFFYNSSFFTEKIKMLWKEKLDVVLGRLLHERERNHWKHSKRNLRQTNSVADRYSSLRLQHLNERDKLKKCTEIEDKNAT